MDTNKWTAKKLIFQPWESKIPDSLWQFFGIGHRYANKLEGGAGATLKSDWWKPKVA